MNKMFNSKLLSKDNKTKLYRYYLYLLHYGCEMRSTTQGDEGKLMMFERKYLRKGYGPTWNQSIGEKLRIGSLINKVPLNNQIKSDLDNVG